MKPLAEITRRGLAVCLLAFGLTVQAEADARIETAVPAGALLYISDSDSLDRSRGSNSVYRQEIAGGAVKRLVGSIPFGDGYLRISDIACERTSQQIVIASHHPELNGFHHARLDGGGLHLDAPGSGDLRATRQIAIAPDGSRILVSRQLAGFAEPRYGLSAGDLITREFASIRAPSATRSYHSPVWSPTGNLIAYIAEIHEGGARRIQLVLALPSGEGAQVVHETPLEMGELAWSPAGEWLALSVNRQIWRVNPGGGELTRLTEHLGGAGSPVFSPDGAYIAYTTPSTFRGQNQLYVMRVDGAEKRRVATVAGGLAVACWI